ncbi:MAG: regulatory protein RecX [Psittacicella sp.]
MEFNFKKYLGYAIFLLNRKDYSKYELFIKLSKHGASKEECIEVISYCIDHNYQSDFRVLEQNYIYYSSRGYGKSYIKNILFKKKIEKSLIDEFFLGIDTDFILLGIELIKKRYKTFDLKSKIRAQRFLSYRGYSFSEIKDILDECFKNEFY